MSAQLDQERARIRRDKRIADSWNRHNVGDISTPRLLQMVQDDCDCDVSRVISGLVREGVLEPAPTQDQASEGAAR